jgi:two-component system, sensor histidine kinase and response regulator
MKRTKDTKQSRRAPKKQPGHAGGARGTARVPGGDSAPPSKLRQREQEQFLLRTLMANIPEHVYFKDRDSRFIAVSESKALRDGMASAAMVGKSDFDLFSEEHARKAFEDEQRIMQTGQPVVDLEERETWPDRPDTWVSTTKLPLRDARGRIVGTFGVSRDITARRRAEEDLRDNEEKFRTLSDSAQDAIVMIDAEDQILSWNRAAERLFGYAKAEAIGARFHPLVVPERFREASSKGLAQFRQTGTGAAIGTVRELAALRKDGSEFPIDLSLSMVKLRDRYLAIGIVRDITERKRTELALREAMEEARASARLKSQFLANMSHEIRTPMNGVVGMTELLLDTELTNEQRSLANTVRTSAESLLTIINDILDFSKIEAGMLTFEQRPFELREPVEGCLQVMAERAHTKGLELAYLIDDNVPVQVIGDAGRLQQVLLNLVGNALKFTEHGEVVVRVTREGEESGRARLRFTVTDTGMGIAPEARKRLFQPFSQADGSITRKFGGTGLGLAISKQLVGLMGGEIGVESEVGRGSTFWFTVRLAAQPAALRVIPRRVDLAGQRALIVDDNQTNRDILQRQLNAWRVATVCAADGESALALLRHLAPADPPFNFALLDMQMPGMSGFDLARQITADPALAGLKLLMLTSMGSMPPFGETAAAGVTACLTKPIQQADLHEAIASLLGMGKPRPVVPSAPARLPPEPKPLRILLAEDNVVNQNVARMQLARLGYMVDITVDGRAALEAAQTHPYDVVLMDCQMPEMDGYEATRHLRAWEQTRHAAGENSTPLYIIAMTASAMAGDREACLAAGMDDYISKPVQGSELAAALARCTTNKV